MALHLYNIMSCQGFDVGFLGGCSMAWFNLVILFLVISLIRKWVFEALDMSFEFWFAIIAGLLLDVVMITFTGSFKIGLGVGLIVGLAVGAGLPYFTGGGNEENYSG